MEATFHPASQQAPPSTPTSPRLPAATKPSAASPTVQRRHGRAPAPRAPLSRIVAPVRYSCWVNGDLGKNLEKTLAQNLEAIMSLRITRMDRAFFLEGDEAPGVFLESVQRALERLERQVQQAYPVFHHEFGPVWTGTLQTVFT